MADHILDKGYKVLTTYNGSNANGVTAFRFIKAVAGGTIDLQTTGGGDVLGVVQESVDRAKVATGKVVANVRLIGISKVYVAATGAAPTFGGEVMVATDGGVVTWATGNRSVGLVTGPVTGTIANGDLIDVLIVSVGRKA